MDLYIEYSDICIFKEYLNAILSNSKICAKSVFICIYLQFLLHFNYITVRCLDYIFCIYPIYKFLAILMAIR